MKPSHSTADGPEAPPPKTELAERLDRLIGEQLVTNHFQPIVDLATRRVFAYEALCRPRDGHFENPKQLVTAAAECGRVGAFGRLQRTLAVGECASWPLFLNIEPNEFDEPFLVRPDDPIFRHRHPVYLEITESVPISFFSQCQSILAEIRKKGILLAIDDLGAGFSNLQYISALAPEIVKLDRELIRGCARDTRSFTLLRSMTSLCHSMNARIIAEGIETEAELEAVLEAGVDFGQGYLLAKPATPPPSISWPAAVAAGRARDDGQGTGTRAEPAEEAPAADGESQVEEQLQLEIRGLRAELAESEYHRENLAGRLKVLSHRLRELESKIARAAAAAHKPLPEQLREPGESSDQAADTGSGPGPVARPLLRSPALGLAAATLLVGLTLGWLLFGTARQTDRARATEEIAPPAAQAGAQRSPSELAVAEAGVSRDARDLQPAESTASPGPAESEPASVVDPEPAADEAPMAAAEVVAAVSDWADAWSSQDADRYLAAYSDRFEPPDGLGLAAWRFERRRRLLAPQEISVTLTGLEITFPEPERARAVFTQFYESPGYNDRVRKTLELAAEEDGWRIVLEQALAPAD
jgi:EAL domain-containing protein (putative c-di-GMP-specific phosphodiesterase class I)